MSFGINRPLPMLADNYGKTYGAIPPPELVSIAVPPASEPRVSLPPPSLPAPPVPKLDRLPAAPKSPDTPAAPPSIGIPRMPAPRVDDRLAITIPPPLPPADRATVSDGRRDVPVLLVQRPDPTLVRRPRNVVVPIAATTRTPGRHGLPCLLL